MVRKNDKPPTLKHVTEVTYSGEAGPELSIEGGIPLLSGLQFL
jgi:hypothetical protein